ncbi:thioredoxin domain-containing protein [Candidatus Woesearchaeota archaeon]|nr:thioredoxin domain-containing protein [Candidatus Woesearchaeota archaeon]
MAVTDSPKDTLKKQRERLLLEMRHLEQTYKSGLLRLQEYTLAKKAVDKKISLLEQKQKQFEAKEKAVEEILGASSILSSQNSKEISSHEKQHHKYFEKIEKPKTVVSQNGETSSKPFKDLSKPLSTKDASEKIKEKIVEKKTDAEKKPQKKKEIRDKEARAHKEQSSIKKEQIPASEHLQIPHQLPADSLPSSVLDSSISSPPCKNIDELVEQEDSNWRFALAILTLFLLILLYVKFTSFGGSSDVLTVDAYLDINSQYSKDMHGVLAQLMSDYGQSLWVSNHIVGSTPESILAGTAAACADQQEHGSEYLDYLFSQDAAFATDADAIAVASTLGLDAASFSACLADPAVKKQYISSQEEIASLDISYTPTLIINNKKVVGAVGYDAVKIVIDKEMTSLG